MKKNGHRLLTLAALVGTAAGVIHIANRFIDATSQLKDMLEQPHSRTYDWRFGKIFYTKQGHGTPILLIHDIMPGASGYEWNAIEKQLATEHTVYTIDLLGCGRSEKPDITYFNLETTTISPRGREFLNYAQKNGAVVSLSDELPQSYVLADSPVDTIYLSELSPAALKRRTEMKLE